MPRSPIVRRLLAAAALLPVLVLPWPRQAGLDALLGRLLAAWTGVTAGVEEPSPPPNEREPSDPSATPAEPGEGEQSGPSIDPDGSSLGSTASTSP